MKSEPIVSVRTYAVVWASLLILTVTTTGVAFIDLGGWNGFVAVSIGIVKAILVILYFMHVRFSQRLTWVFAGAGFFWLAILLGLTMSDTLTRPQVAPPAIATQAEVQAR
jgi:cytochrome c oxidase subunit 4